MRGACSGLLVLAVLTTACTSGDDAPDATVETDDTGFEAPALEERRCQRVEETLDMSAPGAVWPFDRSGVVEGSVTEEALWWDGTTEPIELEVEWSDATLRHMYWVAEDWVEQMSCPEDLWYADARFHLRSERWSATVGWHERRIASSERPSRSVGTNTRLDPDDLPDAAKEHLDGLLGSPKLLLRVDPDEGSKLQLHTRIYTDQWQDTATYDSDDTASVARRSRIIAVLTSDTAKVYEDEFMVHVTVGGGY